ncbi:Primase C terminal 1 (PriCT-1) [Alkalibacterium gilvum]|uniref:Primase C terminal 1 (PriCT-1) n=1 Tax=Alkalibacterium gilvum TaxID=1130080 RepID=A0A1H6RZH3_9LACT|nr:primase alpha helix C-terminal domain-containing protein [Alkalibacterium gilvum]SEI58984.1 Primase C terminal 1 (PriCT-1) [Alkalibacterium gilvum]
MIYISKGYETKNLTPVKSELDDFETIVNSKITTFEDVSSVDVIKRLRAYYFISGELSEPIRSNKTLLRKTLLAIDYDGLDLTAEEFESHLLNKINALTFYAYPSIRHGMAGTRYRLIIKTDRPFTKEENTPLIKFVTDHIGLPYDQASETWSQAMGLKVTFEDEESYLDKCIYNEGKGVLKIDNAIEKMAERTAKKKDRSKPAFTVQYSRKRTFTAEFLESLIDPVEKGSRNVHLTKLIGKMFSLGMTAEAVYSYAYIINEYSFEEPLDDEEVNKTFRSILKKDVEKMEKEGAD